MLFKLIIFIIIVVMIYRFFGGKIPLIDRDKNIFGNRKSNNDNDFTNIAPTSKCDICGTYMTENDAIIYQKKSYCSNECLEKAQKKG
jgi:hypothetical protein